MTELVPVRLGHDIYFWNCESRERVMPGASNYWVSASKTQGEQGQSNEPSAISYLRGVKRIRLDVIDTNPRAKKLYQLKVTV
jgi:hypothetical protein